MFGYACDETPTLMPFPIYYAHRLVQRQSEVRKDGRLPWLRPDAKSQVTVRYMNGKPVAIDTVVLSTQHAPSMNERQKALAEAVIDEIIKPVLPANMLAGTKYLVNPTGRFEIGGPHGDCGLTGRKIIVDTYGGAAPHGGGAFSGKDPSKVDRSAAYAARYVAKNIVAAGLATQCQVQLSYAIGVAPPDQRHGVHGKHRQASRRQARRARQRSTSTCGRKASSDAGPAAPDLSKRPPPTAISAATSPSSPGRPPTRSKRSRPRPASDATSAAAGRRSDAPFRPHHAARPRAAQPHRRRGAAHQPFIGNGFSGRLRSFRGRPAFTVETRLDPDLNHRSEAPMAERSRTRRNTLERRCLGKAYKRLFAGSSKGIFKMLEKIKKA